MPDILEEIGEDAFKECSRLRTINLPVGLKKILGTTLMGNWIFFVEVLERLLKK